MRSGKHKKGSDGKRTGRLDTLQATLELEGEKDNKKPGGLGGRGADGILHCCLAALCWMVFRFVSIRMGQGICVDDDGLGVL